MYSIHASLGVPLSEPLLPAVLGELVKHLQYSRGQCHAPVDRMIAAYEVRMEFSRLCMPGGGRQGPTRTP